MHVISFDSKTPILDYFGPAIGPPNYSYQMRRSYQSQYCGNSDTPIGINII